MANYYPRAIQPTDSLLFDSDGNIVGIRSGSSKDAILYGMTPTQNTAFQAMVSKPWKITPGAWPMQLPGIMGSAPTVTLGIANAASAIASSVLIDAFMPGAFDYLGGRAQRLASNNGGFARMGYFPYKTSAAPVVVQFRLDTADSTGRFEVYSSGSGSSGDMRIAIRNASSKRWEYVAATSSITHAADGNGYLDLITLGAAGVYEIRLECAPSCKFGGVRVAPTDTVTAIGKSNGVYAFVGDSFSEPTFSDAGSYVLHDGYVQRLAYLTGLDLWSAGSGGTGYINPNGGASRVKFADRMAADILTIPGLKGVFLAGGINDYSYASATPALVAAEVTSILAACVAAGVTDNYVLSPFWAKGAPSFPADLLQWEQAIKAAALTAGAKYISLLDAGPAQFLTDYGDGAWTATLNSATTTGSTSVTVSSRPTYYEQSSPALDKWWVRIGSGATQIVRQVTNISGTAGAWVLSFSGAAGVVIPAGSPVVLCGPSYQTGSGKQGSTAGDGNSDRYTGSDGTHPTKAGHENLARVIAARWASAALT